MLPRRCTVVVVLITVCLSLACATRSMATYGLAAAEGLGQTQRDTKALEQAGIIATDDALAIQEALLKANDLGVELVPVLRAIEATTGPTRAVSVTQAQRLTQAMLAAAAAVATRLHQPRAAAAAARLDGIVANLTTLTSRLSKLRGTP